MNLLYKVFVDEIQKSSKAWLEVDTALTQNENKNREKLVFEEQQIEKHVQRLIATYQSSLRLKNVHDQLIY